MSTVKPAYLRLLFLSFIILGLVFLSKFNHSQAGTLESVSVRMTNSRPSYRGAVKSVSGTIVEIEVDTAGGITDYTIAGDAEATDVLKVNDIINFGTPAVPINRTIQEIVDDDHIILTTAPPGGNDTFFLAEESDLEVRFTTRTHVVDGSFQVMVPAAASDSNNGIPDQGFFDYGHDTSDAVSCSGTNHTFTGGASSSAGQEVTDYGGRWHLYNCAYTGGGVGDDIEIDISSVINPMPAAVHDTGKADTYDVYVRHLDDGGGEIDVTRVKIGVIEAVRVSATVPPSLRFTIFGQDDGTAMCGTTSHVTTLPHSVPFGELTVTTFRHATQILDVATNAVDGAAVTVLAYDQLGRNGVACTGNFSNQFDCIWDANVAGMTHETAANWITAGTQTGFGYSIDGYEDRANPAFEYDDGGTWMAKHFPDYNRGATPQDAQLLFDTDDDPTNQADIKLCYRINLDAITAAGEYYTYINYTATATF